MRRAVLVVAACGLLASGCGVGKTTGLRTTAFEPPDGAERAAGEKSRESGSQTRRFKTFSVRPSDGDTVTFGVTLVNRGKARIVVGGVQADEDVDGYLRSVSLDPERVTLAPGDETPVTVTTEVTGCAAGGGTVRNRQDQRFAITEDGDERDVQSYLPAIMVVACG